MSLTLSILTTLLLLLKFNTVNSQCSDLSAGTCANDGYCSLNGNSDCVCSKTWNQDIAFIFDSSMSEDEWSNATQFAADLLYFGTPDYDNTRVAILQTGDDDDSTSTVTLDFDSGETVATTYTTTLPSLNQTVQTNFYLQISMEYALSSFNSLSSTTRRKILIIFASQEFSQSPCQINMRQNEIYTYTIAMGDGWYKYPLICVGSSENDYEGFIDSVTEPSQLSAILTTMESITCPHQPLLKLTEIQLAGVNGVQYIEFFNYGHSLDMSQISLGGDFGERSLDSVIISMGDYGVVYNTDRNEVDNADFPVCNNCTCDRMTQNTDWCSNAVYMGCCDQCTGNDGTFELYISDCNIFTGLSMTAFTIELDWTNPADASVSTIESVTFDSTESGDGYWPTVETNYALELVERGYNNKFGSSWIMSCTTDGSPGDKYLSSGLCEFSCATDSSLCNLNGGWNTENSTGCIIATDSCDCLKGYYSHYHTCLALPSPTECITTYITSAASDGKYDISSYDGATEYALFVCENPTGCETVAYSITVTSSLNPLINDVGRLYPDSATEITNSIIGSDAERYYSVATTCNLTTSEPTKGPTPSPTFDVPAIPSCNITVAQNLKSFEIMWEPLILSINSAVDEFYGYVYYFNGVKRSSPAQCCSTTGTPPGGVDFDVLNDIVSVSGDWDSTITDVSEFDEKSTQINCTMYTYAPTAQPTSDPTNVPTPNPTKDPTAQPTSAPTLQNLEVPWCHANVLPQSSSLNLSWGEANFDEIGFTTAQKDVTYYYIYWSYLDGSFDTTLATATSDNERIITIENYWNLTILEMYCVWTNGGFFAGNHTECTISTSQPTLQPTSDPTSDPTSAPTSEPTAEPTHNPSSQPTSAPTFTFYDIEWCHAVFSTDQFNVPTITMYWDLLQIDEPNTPSSNVIQYKIEIGTNGKNEYTAWHQSTYMTTNYMNGSIVGYSTYPLQSDDVGDYDVSPIIVYAIYDGFGVQTSMINCSTSTQEPTRAPTSNPTSQPTLSPTYDGVRVYLENVFCSQQRCGCKSDWISTCCYGSCDFDKNPLPVSIVNEKETADTAFYAIRNIQTYPYTIEVFYNISIVTQDMATRYGFYSRIEEMEAGDVMTDDNSTDNNSTTNNTISYTNITYQIPDDCYFDPSSWHPNCKDDKDEDEYCKHCIDKNEYKEEYGSDASWCDFYDEPGPRCNDISPMEGSFIIYQSEGDGGNNNDETTFKLSILKDIDTCNNGKCDWDGEVFLLQLTSCTVYTNDSYFDGDIMECNVIYPSGTFILIKNQDPVIEEIAGEVPDDSYEDWLWYVILACVVIAAILGYIAYRWWVNKKMKEADVAQVEEDMEAVIEEQEQGWINTDDLQNIDANPLANVATNINKPAPSYHANANDKNNEKIKDVADVRVEKFDEKIEYGQKMGNDGMDYV